MSRRGWRIWCAWMVVWVTYVVTNIVWDLIGFGRWPEFYATLIAVNCASLAVLWYSHRRMVKLHRSWLAREEELQRRFVHAVEREDLRDIQFTLTLMDIWKIKPKRPVPSAPDGQDGGGLPF